MKRSKRRYLFFSKKRYGAICISILALSLLTTAFILFHKNGNIGDAAVFTMNDEPVSKTEFTNMMSGLRANVFSYFVQKYGVKDSANFWTTRFGEEVPIEVLKQRTLDKLKKIKIEQIAMKTHGIANDISYSGYLKKLNDENEQRKKAVEKKQPIYGPVQYDVIGYYDVLHENRIEQLKNKLADKELAPTEEEIKHTYNENKETKYKKIDAIKYEKIAVSFVDGNGNTSADRKSKAEDMASKIKADVTKGGTFEASVNTFKNQGESGIDYQALVFNESTYKVDSRTSLQLIMTLNELNDGQISDVFEENASFNVVKVLEKKRSGYKTLDEVREQVKKELVDKKYVEFIDKLVHEAIFIVNDKVYNRIS